MDQKNNIGELKKFPFFVAKKGQEDDKQRKICK